ncbi:uncharacterized protein LOC130013713 [Patella vulgata]|uniref:uncharacterized protein LOC130013713 n=1 Tax=Patella vulgata TaxID=6465 RepID=UPI0024A808EA|nr:uncharacterized protein LOC130013713 [Patella vulgata]
MLCPTYTCTWKEDELLKSSLHDYVLQNLSRSEILDYMKRDFDQYTWCLPTLSRRLAYFGIKYVNYQVGIDHVVAAIEEELQGPGKLLGYRLLHKKIRVNHKLAVPRQLVYDILTSNHDDLLEKRAPKIKRRKRGGIGTFTSLGPNHTYSADGHDKLMGFQRNMFPFAIYGVQDVYSCKLLYVKVGKTNKNPKIIGKWYHEFISRTGVISQILRLDKGSENGHMATIHAYLQSTEFENPEDSVIFGSSTSNKIERWWRELHSRLVKYFKEKFQYLFDQGYYNPDEITDREILALVYLPLVQEEINKFVELWNNHRMRKQNSDLPKGIPNHLYDFPETYGSTECGSRVSEAELEDVKNLADVLDDGAFVDKELERRSKELLPNLSELELTDALEAYLYLKSSMSNYRLFIEVLHSSVPMNITKTPLFLILQSLF